MIELVKWAAVVHHPLNGGTAESQGRVWQAVADVDDLEWAVDLAEQRNLLPGGLCKAVRADPTPYDLIVRLY